MPPPVAAPPRAAARVVINADDLGLHPDVNDGVARAYEEGVVTSASLMTCGAAFAEALERLRRCPGLGVGWHLTLVEEAPAAGAAAVPSLVGADGRMPRTYREFAARWLSGRIRAEDVRRELRAQLARARTAGLALTHADSHQHVHCLPGVFDLVLDLVRAEAIPFLRLPRFEALRRHARGSADPLLRAVVNVLAAVHARRWPSDVQRADWTEGLSVSGRMRRDELLRLLEAPRPGWTEIMVHPGTSNQELGRLYCTGPWAGFDWAGELAALTDPRVRTRCAEGDFTLRSFGGAAAS